MHMEGVWPSKSMKARETDEPTRGVLAGVTRLRLLCRRGNSLSRSLLLRFRAWQRESLARDRARWLVIVVGHLSLLCDAATFPGVLAIRKNFVVHQ
jgi:hypothetical protein